jgi:clan AA aspartic protease (TIGR02281 family)
MKYLILFYFCLITITQAIAQDIVKMEKSGGVYLIPCKVNGVPLKFIFDTGASDVSISLTEALFMLKNGYLKESDIKGTVYYSIANGEIAEGTRINIQKIEVGKQTLYNVEASIVHSTEAPLLFGQSAMERFGKFTMDYSNSNLIIGEIEKSFTDKRNNKTYKILLIDTELWMEDNLKADRFRNGDIIPEARTSEDWEKAGKNKQPAWCYYNNDPVNNEKYGKLYNWYAVKDSRGLAPEGWRIPDPDECWNFNLLRRYPFKSGGLRDSLGGFGSINEVDIVWSSIELDSISALKYDCGFFPKSALAMYINYGDDEYTRCTPNKADGLSVRCIKD